MVNITYYERYLESLLYLISEDKNTKIGILGYTFKANADDTRDSIVPRIVRSIEGRFFNNILISDYNITVDELEPEHIKYYRVQSDLLEEADVVIIAMNHDDYKKLEYDHKYILDLWNVTGKNEMLQSR